MTPNFDDAGVETLLCHFGEEEQFGGAVVTPIFQNSLFTFEQMEGLAAAMSANPADSPHHYSRLSNPTVSVAEKKIAALEGAEACKLFGGGIGAITNAILSEVKQGAHVVCVDTAYGPTKNFLNDYLAKFGVTTTFVTGHCVDEIASAIRPETTLIVLESPSSLLFRLQDLPAITAIAREKGITTMIDNTYATPLRMKPLEHGIDIVVHSATKYLGGHSDITAGAVCTDQARIDKMVRNEVNYLGGLLHPMSGWLLTRGLRTLSLRLDRHEQTGNTIAAWLEIQPQVEVVHHISLPSYPQADLYKKLFKGSTGLFSFQPKTQDKDKVFAFVNALQIFQRGVSWGGFESLVIAAKVDPMDYENKTWIIRLFCGLENVEDLQRDLAAALPLLD